MKHKLIKNFCLASLMIISMALPSLAYGAGDNTVKVGYIEGAGIVDKISSTNQKGYGYEILQGVALYSDLEFEFVAVTEDTVVSSLNSGEIDLFGPMTQTDSRGAAMDFSRSFGVQQILLVAPASSTLLYNDTATFNGKNVAVMQTLNFNSYLDSYAALNNIRFNYSTVTTYEEYYDQSHELLLTSSLMDVQDRKTVANLGLEQMYFVSKKGNTALINAINSGLSTLEISDPLYTSTVHKKYYGSGNVSKPVLNATQVAALQQKGTFTVGYVSNHFPIESLSDSGSPEGIAVDIMNLVAKEAGIGLTYKSYSATEAVDHNQFDINIAWSSQDDFDQFYYPSTAFEVNSPLVLLTEKGGSSSPATIGILPYVSIEQESIQNSYPGSQLTTYSTYTDLSTALEKGEVAGVILADVGADYLLSLLGDTDYSRHATSHSFPIRIFISKNLSQDYVDILNLAVQRVDDVQIDIALLSQVPNYRAEPSLLELIGNYWYVYVLGIAFVTGSFFAFYLFLQRKKQQAVLDALNYDEITGLCSEIKFISDVESILKYADNDQYMIVTFDVDKFSLIRKQYGYDKSNEVLKRIGQALTKAYPEGSVVARSKADLFLVFSKQNRPDKPVCKEEVIECAQGLLASTHPISASVGCYRINDTTVPVQLMIDYCGMARLQGKSVYGLTLNEYTKELDEKRELNNSIVLRMERALLGKELIPYYQPKVHLKTSMIEGCEALVRWCDIDSDLDIPKVKYMPDEFIPLFEENGFIAKLDYHIFDEICSFIRRNMKLASIPKISINLSGVTLLKNDLRGSLVGTLERYRLLPREIDLEITESAFTRYPKESADQVRMLRKVGFTISMDDFGTGASSLNRLKDMDITTIKLDKAFLDYNLAELKGSVIIGNMINMARRLGLEVVAEGVETKEQLSALKMLHCDLVQGYYYSRPVNEDDFLDMLTEEVCMPSAERLKIRKELYGDETDTQRANRLRAARDGVYQGNLIKK